MKNKSTFGPMALAFLASILCFSVANGQSFGNAVYMNGITDHISIPNHADFDQDSTISIEAWIRPCQVDSSSTLVTLNWCLNGQNAYSFSIDSTLRWTWDLDDCGNSASWYRTDANILLINTWQHVAVVHTPSEVRLFHNGVPVSGTLMNGGYSTIQPSNEPLRFGTYRKVDGSYVNHFHGQLDEVRLWDHDLSDAEVLSRYNSPLSGSENGLICYYDMDEVGMGEMIIVENNALPAAPSKNGVTIGTMDSPTFMSAMDDPCPTSDIVEEQGRNYDCGVQVSMDFSDRSLLVKSSTPLRSIEILSALGRSVHYKALPFGLENRIATSNLAPGAYFVRSVSQDCRSVQKVIIE